LQALNAAAPLLPDVRYSAIQPTDAVNRLLSTARTADSDLDEQEIAEILDTPGLGRRY
jgi:hypothetical protein